MIANMIDAQTSAGTVTCGGVHEQWEVCRPRRRQALARQTRVLLWEYHRNAYLANEPWSWRDVVCFHNTGVSEKSGDWRVSWRSMSFWRWPTAA